jgi:hypothetical protein
MAEQIAKDTVAEIAGDDEWVPPEWVPPVNLVEALLRIQEELPKVERTGENPGFKRDGKPSKYMTIDAVMEAALPVLSRNGVVWIAAPGYAEHEGRREAVLNYTVTHVLSGEKMQGHMLLLSARDDPQGQGAAITYARRQTFTSLFNITADEDDDGERAAGAKRAADERQREARAGARVLSAEQRESMMTAVREADLDVAETLERAGIDPDGDVTAAQSRQVRAMIEATKEAAS